MINKTKHDIIWRLLRPIICIICKIKFNYTYEKYESDKPVIVVSNHVTNWDPLWVACSFPKNTLFFVASEHIFRWGILSKIIVWLLSPIPRRKGSNAIDTVMNCVRRIKKGNSICIFGEGEATWNGISNKVIPATGKLAKLSGAVLVTYKIEGAYFSMPRWGKHKNRGKIHGKVVNTYPPEVLKSMTPEEIEDIINSDIYENAWETQKIKQIPYKGSKKAEGLNTALFICPECEKTDTLSANKNAIRCTCGFETEITPTGFFKENPYFETIAKWDNWQIEKLKDENYFSDNEICFSNENIALSEIPVSSHEQNLIKTGTLTQYKDRICLEDTTFMLSDITEMSIVRVHILLFTHNDKYYELRSDTDTCMRKYLAMWQNRK